MSEKSKKTNGKNTKKPETAWIVLGGVCIAAALCLGVVNGITSPVIKKLEETNAIETRQKLLSAATDFKAVETEKLTSLYAGVDDSGNTAGYVGETTVTGYGGEVVVTVGIDMNKKITGVSVGGSNFSESAGLGAKAKGTAPGEGENVLLDQFVSEEKNDAARGYEVVKKGMSGTDDTLLDIDAITSATITSRAVTGGVNQICEEVLNLIDASAARTSTDVGGEAK